MKDLSQLINSSYSRTQHALLKLFKKSSVKRTYTKERKYGHRTKEFLYWI